MKIDYNGKIEISDKEFVKLASVHFSPDEIFEYKELEDWALKNGFVKECANKKEDKRNVS